MLKSVKLIRKTKFYVIGKEEMGIMDANKK